MHLFTVLLIGIAANLDNLGISVSYGLRASRIPFRYNLVISIISMVFTYASITLGSVLSGYLSAQSGNVIGASLLIALGAWLLIKQPAAQDGKSGTIKEITWKESLFLGFIMAVNCLSIGFGAGIAGVEPVLASVSVGVFSFLSIHIGVKVGHLIGPSWFGRQSDRIAGLLLVVIGLFEVIG